MPTTTIVFPAGVVVHSTAASVSKAGLWLQQPASAALPSRTRDGAAQSFCETPPSSSIARRPTKTDDTTVSQKTELCVVGYGVVYVLAAASGDDGDRKKMQGFFPGQIMKATKGQADGRAIAELLASKAN